MACQSIYFTFKLLWSNFKVPKFLAKTWEQETKEGVELGKIRIDQSSGEPKVDSFNTKYKITLVVSDSAPATLPKEYTVKFLSETENVDGSSSQNIVFTAPEHGGIIKLKTKVASLVGHICNEGSVTPEINNAYRNIMRHRMMESNRPTRSLKIMDDKRKTNYLAPVAVTAKDIFSGVFWWSKLVEEESYSRTEKGKNSSARINGYFIHWIWKVYVLEFQGDTRVY